MDTVQTSAWGTGLATLTADDAVLDVWFPDPHLGSPEAGLVEAVEATLEEGEDELLGTRRRIVTVESDLTAPVTGTEDAYLRLHLLSKLLVQPNGCSLDGLIPALPINVWTNRGPVSPAWFDAHRPQLRAAGVVALGLDKFPRLLDYVTPERVRIADGDRVRLGAHLAPGTTVMHEGFVNFNAGTLGSSMVEGRISQGVVVGDGADVGGGASIMGTLSGGGKERIEIGARALLGANSGVGISIGEDSIVEAGLYVTAGTKVRHVAEDGTASTVKAKELSGAPNLLFRRNSSTGEVEAIFRRGTGIELNAQLHA